MNKKTLKLIHNVHLCLVLLLLFSGLSLYIQQLRTFFNEWKIPLVQLHVAIGIIYILFSLLILIHALRYAKLKPSLHRFNVFFHVVLFTLWAVSGLIMEYYSLFSVPIAIRNYSVVIHDYTTFIVIPWIITHSIGHLLKQKMPWPQWWRGRAPKPEWVEENQPNRRDFLKASVFFAAALSLGALAKWMTPVLAAPSQISKRRGYFRIYNVTSDYPRLEDEREWELKIDGLVKAQRTLTFRNMREIPWETLVDDFHCVTGWSVRGVEMRGIYVKDLLKHFEVEAQGQFVNAYSADGIYMDSFHLSQLVDEGAMLVFEMDGVPLKQIQGFPCRLYHPEMYGYKSVKWLNRLEVTNKRELGYWQKSGDYDLNGYL